MQPSKRPPQAEDDEHFEAKKEHLHDDAHGGGHGGTEMGWLVSYADMMTLLFGLFVILFSLATSKPKEMEGILKDASKKYFRSSKVEGTTTLIPGGEVPEDADKPFKPVEVKAPKIEAPVTKVTGSITADEVTDLQTSLKQEKQKYEIKMHEFALKLEKVEDEKKLLQSKIKNLERKPSTSTGTTPVAVTTPAPEMPQSDSQHTAALKEELEKAKAEAEGLRSELEKEKNKIPMQSYMMVLVAWETEKHDLDLQITTPTKKTFSFKKRKIGNEPGAFVLDSRYGPGVEMWRSENFTPGRYKAKVSLYNKNGNTMNPKLQLNVLTNLQSYKTQVLELDGQKSEIEIIFDVDKEGVVQLQK